MQPSAGKETIQSFTSIWEVLLAARRPMSVLPPPEGYSTTSNSFSFSIIQRERKVQVTGTAHTCSTFKAASMSSTASCEPLPQSPRVLTANTSVIQSEHLSN